MSYYPDYDEGYDDEPTVIASYRGIKAGDHVVYHNPAWRQPDGTYATGGMDPPLVITELCQLGPGNVLAVINDGEWEVNADNLELEEGQ